MRLNKEICKRCMSITPCFNGIVDKEVKQTNDPVPWSTNSELNDEFYWGNGMVHCPHVTRERPFEEAIIDCPYFLEHSLC